LANALVNQASYECWVGFALKTHSWVVMLAQGIGIIGATTLVVMVLHYTIRPAKTSFEHYLSPRCIRCREVLAELPVLTRAPFPCFGCPGSFHAIKTVPVRLGSDYSITPDALLPKGAFEAICDVCSRVTSFHYGGPLNDPAWWRDLEFWLRESRVGTEYRKVTMIQYVEAELRFLGAWTRTEAGPVAMRAGVPSLFEFSGSPNLESGRITTTDGVSLLVHFANMRGEEVKREREAARRGS
jgi:hypothetical protein